MRSPAWSAPSLVEAHEGWRGGTTAAICRMLPWPSSTLLSILDNTGATRSRIAAEGVNAFVVTASLYRQTPDGRSSQAVAESAQRRVRSISTPTDPLPVRSADGCVLPTPIGDVLGRESSRVGARRAAHDASRALGRRARPARTCIASWTTTTCRRHRPAVCTDLPGAVRRSHRGRAEQALLPRGRGCPRCGPCGRWRRWRALQPAALDPALDPHRHPGPSGRGGSPA
jgi:hypothetical protein